MPGHPGNISPQRSIGDLFRILLYYKDVHQIWHLSFTVDGKICHHLTMYQSTPFQNKSFCQSCTKSTISNLISNFAEICEVEWNGIRPRIRLDRVPMCMFRGSHVYPSNYSILWLLFDQSSAADSLVPLTNSRVEGPPSHSARNLLGFLCGKRAKAKCSRQAGEEVSCRSWLLLPCTCPPKRGSLSPLYYHLDLWGSGITRSKFESGPERRSIFRQKCFLILLVRGAKEADCTPCLSILLAADPEPWLWIPYDIWSIDVSGVIQWQHNVISEECPRCPSRSRRTLW